MVVLTEDQNVNEFSYRRSINAIILVWHSVFDHHTYNHLFSLPHLVDASGGDEVNSWLCTCGHSFTYSNS